MDLLQESSDRSIRCPLTDDPGLVYYDKLQAISDDGDCLPIIYLFQETTMKTLLALLMSSAFVILAGCNTVAGAGKDLERGGEKVQDTAKDVQQKM
jgi:predicted small secreted protein